VREVLIRLPDHVAHVLEVRAAIDGMRLPEGIERILAELVKRFDERRSVCSDS
jgi:hypothetical protein